jgi:cell filamentation protein
MYDAIEDPYCYQGTTVLKNLANAKTQVELDKFELLATTKRAEEPLPGGDLDDAHYCAIHQHLFQDVYSWAGDIRTVRISKDGNMFCYPENIEKQMCDLFEDLAGENHFRDLDAESFACKAAHFMSELNAIHPFREGNGRSQNTLLILLADQARHPLNLERLDPLEMMHAMIASFEGDEKPLERLILQLMRVPPST